MARRAWLRLFPAHFARRAEPSPRELGLLGERLAARHLRRAGWRVLARRLRTARGEVDILASRGAQLACVEVKTARVRSLEAPPDPRTRPGRRYDRARWRRQRAAARLLHAEPPRLDLVEVWIERGSGRWRAVHHKGSPDARGPTFFQP